MSNRKSVAVACCAGICCCTAAVADPAPAPPHDGVDLELGGRLVHEFAWSRDSVGPFDRHCFAPGVCARLSDRAAVAAEIELAQDGLAGGRGDGEVALTFAVLDYRFRDEFQFRGGIVQSPLGGINLHHGSPLDDLTELPLVDGSLLHSSQRESGLGVFGALDLGRDIGAGYEAYLVNATVGDDAHDGGTAQAVVARLEVCPHPHLGLGFSAHTGRCNGDDGARRSIAALDVRAEFGGLRLRGAVARATADAEQGAGRRGAYAQLDWRALHDALLAGSTVDLIARADGLDLGVDADRESALTLGVNFLPSSDAVFRLDHTWTRTTTDADEGRDAPGRTRFSVATCF